MTTSKIRSALMHGVVAVGSLVPVLVSAQANALDTVDQSTITLLTIVSRLSLIAFMAILLFFFWAIAKYIWGGAEDKEETKNLLIWAVVALFVAASIWGIVQVLKTTFGVGDETSVNIPRAF